MPRVHKYEHKSIDMQKPPTGKAKVEKDPAVGKDGGSRTIKKISKEQAASMEMPTPKAVGLTRTRSSSFSDTLRHTSPSELPAGVDWLSTYDTQRERTIHADPSGQHMEEVYKHHHTEVAREVVDRSNVVDILKKGHEDRIAHLEQWIAALPDDADPHEMLRLAHQLQLTRANLDEVTECQEKGQTWSSSGSFRRLLELGKSTADQKYIPGCVNLRSHKVVENGEVTTAVNRSGAISDYRNGATNLKEMKELRDELALVNDMDFVTPQQWDVVHRGLHKFQVFDNIEDLKATLDKSITERQWVLENQALQDLTIHFSQKEASDGGLAAWARGQESISFSRVSMLDGVKPARQDGEFVLDEKNQMEDMTAIYNDVLDGKEIVFDGTGPFLDPTGKIHMPFNVQDETGVALTKPLDVTYFNISAQGNIKNEGPQKAINARAMDRLTAKVDSRCEALIEQSRLADAAALQRRLQTLKRYLDHGMRDGFDGAEEAAMLLIDTNCLLSANCFSGKDRTGELLALITFNQLKGAARRMGLQGEKKKAWLAKCGRKTMSKNGLACRIVADNTGHKALKLSVPRIKVLHSTRAVDYLKGVAQRLKLFIGAAATFVVPAGNMGDDQLWAA